MTVCEIYEQDIRDLPPMEQLRLASLILDQLTGPLEASESDLRRKIHQATPSNDLLLALAAAHAPPQSWWDEDDVPEPCQVPGFS